jgi:hypothetical protein
VASPATRSFVQQLPALAGVVIGALATYSVRTWTERAKWQRALRTRWDGKRFNAYAEYGLAVQNYVNLLRRVAGDMGLDSVAHPLARSAGLPEIERAEGERAGVIEKVLLLGDQATIDVARAWHRTAWELAYLVQGVSSGGAAEWRAALDNVWAARDRYYRAARLSLGVPDDLQ